MLNSLLRVKLILSLGNQIITYILADYGIMKDKGFEEIVLKILQLWVGSYT